MNDIPKQITYAGVTFDLPSFAPSRIAMERMLLFGPEFAEYDLMDHSAYFTKLHESIGGYLP